MALLAVTGLIVLLAAVFGPAYWIRHVIARHGAERAELPGTGGELAEHLASELGLDGVRVEITDKGDHYDPENRTVRLLPQHFDGRSITAVAVATHEIGHAIQHHRGEPLLALRQRLAKFAAVTDRLASLFFLAAPVLTVIVRSPAAFIALALIGIGLLGVRLVVHLITLPVETDASFGKAMPILEQGGYLASEDLPAARQVLRAAAWTYVAAALSSLLNLARWIKAIR